MLIATPSNASTDCNLTGVYTPVLTATFGTNTIDLASGYVGGNSTCSVTVDVTADDFGKYVNTTGVLIAPDGVTCGKASAVLDVAPPFLSKSFTDDPVPPGGTVTLEFTITNLHATQSVSDITFTDDLEAVLPGLVATGLPTGNVCNTGSVSGANTLAFTGGNLGPGASCTFPVELEVPDGATLGTYPNTTTEITGTYRRPHCSRRPGAGRPPGQRIKVFKVL